MENQELYNTLINTISKYINLHTISFQKDERGYVRIDERKNMYGGKGVVYMLQMFGEKELANNRIGAYMVLLNKGDESGFHTHGDRNEEEIYLVIHGSGEYRERNGMDQIIRKRILQKGNIAVINSYGYHSIENINDEPLIIFAITTNVK